MIISIVIAFFSIIFLMVVHEFGHFFIAKKAGVNVEEFGLGYPPRIFGKKIGQTLYSINLIPLGAFVKIRGESGIEDYQSFIGLPMIKRVAIVLGGVISFWIVAIILFSIVFYIGVEVPITDEDVSGLNNIKVQIVKVVPNTPAGIAGLRIGDIITNAKSQISNIKIDKVSDFQKLISEQNGQEITLIIKRGDRFFDVSLVPRVSPPENEGPLGLQLQRTATFISKHPWYQAPYEGVAFCGDLTYKTIESLIKILAGLFSGKGLAQGAEPAGPIGIAVFLARAAEMGVGFFLYFIAAVAALLAIFNLLPIPALDGGKILFLAIEKIRGKSVSPKIEQTITTVFFFLLISLSLFVTIKFDIPRFSDFLKNSF